MPYTPSEQALPLYGDDLGIICNFIKFLTNDMLVLYICIKVISIFQLELKISAVPNAIVLSIEASLLVFKFA